LQKILEATILNATAEGLAQLHVQHLIRQEVAEVVQMEMVLHHVL
jgi:hypothetical protein